LSNVAPPFDIDDPRVFYMSCPQPTAQYGQMAEPPCLPSSFASRAEDAGIPLGLQIHSIRECTRKE